MLNGIQAPINALYFNNQTFIPNISFVNYNFTTPCIPTREDFINFGFHNVVAPLTEEINFPSYTGNKNGLVYTEANKACQDFVENTDLDFIKDESLRKDLKNFLSDTTSKFVDNTFYHAEKYLPILTQILRPEIVNLPISNWVKSMDENGDGKITDAEIAKGVASALIDEVLPDNLTDVNDIAKDLQTKLVALFKNILGIKNDINDTLNNINDKVENKKQEAQFAYVYKQIAEGTENIQEIMQEANKIDENFLEQVDPKYLPKNFDITKLTNAEREKLDTLIDYFFGEDTSIEEALNDIKNTVGEKYYNNITVGRAIDAINAAFGCITSEDGEKLATSIIDLAGNFDAKDPNTWRKLSETITNLQEARDSGVDTKTIIEETSKVLDSMEGVPEWLTKEALMLLSGDITDEGSAQHLIHGIAKYIEKECDIPWTIAEGTLKLLAGGTSREGLKQAIENTPNRIAHVLENKNAYILGGSILGVGLLVAFPWLTLGTGFVAAAIGGVAWYWDDFSNNIKNSWDDVCKSVKRFGDNACETGKKIWNNVCNAAEDTWNNVCNTAKKAWDGLCSLF